MRKIIVAIVLVVLLAGAAAFFVLRDRGELPFVRTYDLKWEPMPTPARAVQPYCWSFWLPEGQPKESYLWLKFRVKSSNLSKPWALSATHAAMPAAEAEREFSQMGFSIGAGHTDYKPTVSICLLDLTELNAVPKSGGNLRMITRMSANGGTGESPNDLPPGRIAGQTVAHEGKWNNGELYLMTFYIEDGEKLWRYDAFLQPRVETPTTR